MANCRHIARALTFGGHDRDKPQVQADWLLEMGTVIDYVRNTLVQRLEYWLKEVHLTRQQSAMPDPTDTTTTDASRDPSPTTSNDDAAEMADLSSSLRGLVQGTTDDSAEDDEAAMSERKRKAAGTPLLNLRGQERQPRPDPIDTTTANAPSTMPASGKAVSPKLLKVNTGDVATGGRSNTHSPVSGSGSPGETGIRGVTLQRRPPQFGAAGADPAIASDAHTSSSQQRTGRGGGTQTGTSLPTPNTSFTRPPTSPAAAGARIPAPPGQQSEATAPAATSNIGASFDEQAAMETNRGAGMPTGGRQIPPTPLSTKQLGKQPATDASPGMFTRSRAASIAPVVTRSRAASIAPAPNQVTVESAGNTGASTGQAAVAGGSDTGAQSQAGRPATPPPIRNLPVLRSEHDASKTIDDVIAACDFLGGDGTRRRVPFVYLTRPVQDAIREHLEPFRSPQGWISINGQVKKDDFHCARHKLGSKMHGTGDGMGPDWIEPCTFCMSWGVPCMRRQRADVPAQRALVVPTTIRRDNEIFDEADPKAWVDVREKKLSG